MIALADLPELIIMLLSAGAHLLFIIWFFTLLPPHTGEHFELRLIGAPILSALLAYIAKSATAVSTTMAPEYVQLLNTANSAVLYFFGGVFVFIVVAAIVATVQIIIESRQPPRAPWAFYVDAQGRHCMKGKFLYRWYKGKGREEQVCTRSFDGTIEEFLAFNQKWQPCEEQESYRLAATQKLDAIHASATDTPAQAQAAHTNG